MIEGDLFQEGRAADKSTFKNVVSEYLRYWYLFITAIALCVIGVYFHLRYTVPKYYVGTTILIKDQGEGPGLLANASMSGMDMLNADKVLEDEIIVLKSKSLMYRVLAELRFNTSYYLEGRVQDMEVYETVLPLKVVVNKLNASAFGKKIFIYPKDNNSFQLGESGADGAIRRYTYQFGQQIMRPYAHFTVIQTAHASSAPSVNEKVIVVFNDLEALSARYNNALVIEPVNKNSNVLSIGMADAVSRRSVDILNKLIEVYKNEAVEDKNMIASSALSFIDERLQYLNTELTDVEKNVELYKKQNDLTDVSSEAALYLKSADDYNKKLAEFDIQIELLRSIEDYLKVKSGDQVELVPSSLNIQDPTLLILISKFNELQLERQRMQRTTQPGNPLMVNINEQLNNLRVNIGENIRNLIRGLAITRQNLIASSAEFQYRKKMVPAMERELLEINRQQGVKEGLYLYLLQKREESALSLAASVSNFRVIDSPHVLYPIFPNKPLFYAIAVLAGLLIPFSFLYLRNMLNDKILSTADIEQFTETPILGEIARNKSKEVLVVTQNATTPIVEMFRLIRMNLQSATMGKENKVILVTSSISGEGKSFFSLNIAASLVLTGKKVVVLSMDLRKPTLSKSFKLTEGVGITSYLISNDLSVNDIVRPSQVFPNLFIVSSGPILPCPTELMMSPKMADLFNALRASFDHIIIDSAPVGLVADAFTLAPFIDSTIYMMRRNYTPKDRVALIQKIYKEKKFKYPMIVLNDVRIGKGQNYGYGYGEPAKRVKEPKPALRKAS